MTPLMSAPPPRLSILQILQMNIGFLGLQFSFGLQQSNMSPIYSYLGADEAALPLLALAGPVTGLLVQPIVGAMSDRTTSRWGRRTPYFFIGAMLCSLCLLVMPYSSALWMAASLLWILDAANNITMEPYRAYVSDRLPKDQHALGYLTQSAFTGLAQTLSYLAPSIMVWMGMNKDAVGGNHIPPGRLHHRCLVVCLHHGMVHLESSRIARIATSYGGHESQTKGLAQHAA